MFHSHQPGIIEIMIFFMDFFHFYFLNSNISFTFAEVFGVLLRFLLREACLRFFIEVVVLIFSNKGVTFCIFLQCQFLHLIK